MRVSLSLVVVALVACSGRLADPPTSALSGMGADAGTDGDDAGALVADSSSPATTSCDRLSFARPPLHVAHTESNMGLAERLDVLRSGEDGFDLIRNGGSMPGAHVDVPLWEVTTSGANLSLAYDDWAVSATDPTGNLAFVVFPHADAVATLRIFRSVGDTVPVVDETLWTASTRRPQSLTGGAGGYFVVGDDDDHAFGMVVGEDGSRTSPFDLGDIYAGERATRYGRGWSWFVGDESSPRVGFLRDGETVPHVRSLATDGYDSNGLFPEVARAWSDDAVIVAWHIPALRVVDDGRRSIPYSEVHFAIVADDGTIRSERTEENGFVVAMATTASALVTLHFDERPSGSVYTLVERGKDLEPIDSFVLARGSVGQANIASLGDRVAVGWQTESNTPGAGWGGTFTEDVWAAILCWP